jgi:hypothetical protein
MYYRKEESILSNRKINIIKSSPNLDRLLNNYKELINDDFQGYKNHIYRVLTYSLHYLDADKTQDGKVLKYLPVIEAALVYHDIGLWTDRRLSYLELSSSRAKMEFENSWSVDKLELLHNIIYYHHKITPFTGTNEKIVNAVRKSDWIDASLGIVNHGMSSAHIRSVNAALSDSGFHYTLATIGHRYYGNNFVRILSEVSSIFEW